MNKKIIESFDIDEWEVETDTGWHDITHIHKTVPYEKHGVFLENGLEIHGADDHCLFDDYMNPLLMKDCIPFKTKVMTKKGPRMVVGIGSTTKKESMYDVTVDSDDHRYYSNDILSHNTTTTTIFILHYIIFNDHKTVALLANKADAAREILSRIQLAYENLPIWLQQGVVMWNKGSCELENGSKILASSTASSAIRGKSIALLFLDEAAFVPNNIYDEFMRSVYPTISSGKKSRVIMCSTPHGLNHFYKVVEDARNGLSKYKLKEVYWNEVPGRDLEWKKETIANIGQQAFDQEFDLEFQGSSNTLIAGSKLKALTFVLPIKRSNEYKQYALPEEDRIYIVTVDVSQGLGQDYSVVSVFDVTETPFTQTAVFRDDRIDPDYLIEVIYTIAMDYNEALVLVERNDMGAKVADALHSEMEYENTVTCFLRGSKGQTIGYGYGTNNFKGVKMTKTVKAHGCSNLKHLIENDELIIRDFETINELSVFSRNGSSFEADDGKHDDIVMTLVIFAWMTGQDYFKEYTDVNIRKTLSDKYKQMVEDSILPFGFMCDHLDDEDDNDGGFDPSL